MSNTAVLVIQTLTSLLKVKGGLGLVIYTVYPHTLQKIPTMRTGKFITLLLGVIISLLSIRAV